MSNSSDLLDSYISRFFKTEAAGGIILILAAILAVICANSALSVYYDRLLSTPVEIRFGALQIAKPLLLWINDGLMAVFFFLVGLELKREVIEGELSNLRDVVLPGVGAIGGMAVPAMIYVAFNLDDPLAIQGWAIPAATDIAFALGVLALLGSRVPVSIKIFLTSLAIFDDIGAILIIAFFYTAKISATALIIAAACIATLFILHRTHQESRSLYITVGVVMWIALLKSGVHATLAGIILAMFIPMKSRVTLGYSPLKSLEHDLHSMVAFLVLPVFAFANAGLNLSGIGMDQLAHGVPLGIALGLFVGKQVGVFGFCWLAIKLGMSKLPNGMDWRTLYGTAALCGIGFTMSLFIGSLAFEETTIDRQFDERLGIILGSLVSGVLGYLILNKYLPKKADTKASKASSQH
ncbi:Na+/H+ antiporter NhaA [Marinobacterium jannaschii]|uniref:Na+/H+ antiporter NhaA n=1 Tax=Marinobacterium jannaschii TaxID=64970 RepID=UPI000487C8D4|nr:Na+/H+ antiporter NhaA [Marinobacterium jannaschii]